MSSRRRRRQEEGSDDDDDDDDDEETESEEGDQSESDSAVDDCKGDLSEKTEPAKLTEAPTNGEGGVNDTEIKGDEPQDDSEKAKAAEIKEPRERQRRERKGEKLKKDPMFVPHSGKFFLHDDRFDGDPAPPSRVIKGREDAHDRKLPEGRSEVRTR
jgi:hypothetical protein